MYSSIAGLENKIIRKVDKPFTITPRRYLFSSALNP